MILNLIYINIFTRRTFVDPATYSCTYVHIHTYVHSSLIFYLLDSSHSSSATAAVALIIAIEIAQIVVARFVIVAICGAVGVYCFVSAVVAI